MDCRTARVKISRFEAFFGFVIITNSVFLGIQVQVSSQNISLRVAIDSRPDRAIRVGWTGWWCPRSFFSIATLGCLEVIIYLLGAFGPIFQFAGRNFHEWRCQRIQFVLPTVFPGTITHPLNFFGPMNHRRRDIPGEVHRIFQRSVGVFPRCSAR